MQIEKLRPRGLVPAGAYFADIAARLEDLNGEQTARRAAFDAEDRALEARYRKRPVRRAAPPAMM